MTIAIYGGVPLIGKLIKNKTIETTTLSGVFTAVDHDQFMQLAFSEKKMHEYVGPALIDGKIKEVKADAIFELSKENILLTCSGAPEIIR